MISLGPRLLFEFPPSTSSRAETQQQPWSQGNHLSAPCGIIYRVIFFKGQKVNSYYYTIKHVYYIKIYILIITTLGHLVCT